jgi:uncharacterized protein YxjI
MNVMVMSQKPKFIEMTNEYEITDENGTPVGTVRQEGQSKARKLLRLVSSVDQFLTHKLAVRDTGGAKVLELVRPAKVFKSTVEVLDANGTHVGKIVQENIVGKKRFRLDGRGSCARDSRPRTGTCCTSPERVASDAATDGGVGRGRRHGVEAGRHGRCGVRWARLRYLNPSDNRPGPHRRLARSPRRRASPASAWGTRTN